MPQFSGMICTAIDKKTVNPIQGSDGKSARGTKKFHQHAPRGTSKKPPRGTLEMGGQAGQSADFAFAPTPDLRP